MFKGQLVQRNNSKYTTNTVKFDGFTECLIAWGYTKSSGARALIKIDGTLNSKNTLPG